MTTTTATRLEIAREVTPTPPSRGRRAVSRSVGEWAQDDVEDADIEVIKNSGTTYNYEDKTFAYGVKFCEACGSYVEGDARFAVFGELSFVETPALSKLIPSSGFFAAVAAEQVKAFDADVAMLSTIALVVEEVTPDLAKATAKAK